MDREDIEKIQNFAKRFKELNAKVKLLILLQRAKEEYDKNKFSDCKKTCEEVLQSNPENAIALRGLGCVAQIQGDYERAVNYYKKALKTSNKKEIEYTLIGTIYYLQEKLEKAIENYNLAIKANDDYESAYEGRNQSMLEYHLKILDLQDSLIEQELRSY